MTVYILACGYVCMHACQNTYVQAGTIDCINAQAQQEYSTYYSYRESNYQPPIQLILLLLSESTRHRFKIKSISNAPRRSEPKRRRERARSRESLFSNRHSLSLSPSPSSSSSSSSGLPQLSWNYFTALALKGRGREGLGEEGHPASSNSFPKMFIANIMNF